MTKEEQSDLMLMGVRNLIDTLGDRGWQGYTTSYMRMLTDDLLREILGEAQKEQTHEECDE